MPIDYNFENTPSFRDLSQAGLLLMRQPVVRSLAKLRRLRKGLATLPEGPLLRTALTAPSGRDEDRDRGDVPGWVMITVMTAIVVIALLAVFREQVVTAVQNAFESVSGAR